MIFAYLDPGSGSLILQAVLGGLTGIGVAVKARRSRFGRKKVKADPEEGGDGAVEDDPLPADP